MVRSKGEHLGFPFRNSQRGHLYLHLLRARLYANAGINAVYLVSNMYGWYRWSRTGDDNQKLQISRNTSTQNILTWIAVAAIYVVVFSCCAV